MIVYTRKANLRNFLEPLKRSGKTIGFVPTMGALHEGHLSLVRRAAAENDAVVVSIFVNPTQFDNPDDLAKYPRLLERDLSLLEEIDPGMIIYLPVAGDLYEGPVRARSYDLDGLDEVMEGKFRPGHFAGVATVVHLLLDAVRPDRAYFGEKDFQQLRIIERLVNKLKLPVSIIPVPIVREDDGLAMSSRNLRLNEDMRKAASFIYRMLRYARRLADEGLGPEEIRRQIRRRFAEESPLRLEYIEIADENTLLPAETFLPGKHYRAFIAAYAGDVRLIDNLRIK